MNIELIINWLNFTKGSVFDGLFWLFPVLMIIGFFYLRRFKYNKSILSFMVITLILMYLEPYNLFRGKFVGNYRYFYQMIPFMIVIAAPGVLILAEKLQLFSVKYKVLTRYTKGKYSLTIVLIVISAICLGFSLSQRSEHEKNYIFEPIKIINSISKKDKSRPIYIYEEENDQGRVPYYINAVQSNIIKKGESPERILKMCKALTFLDRNIFVYVRMSDSEFRTEFHGPKQDFKLKLLKEVVYQRHKVRTVFSLYQYEG